MFLLENLRILAREIIYKLNWLSGCFIIVALIWCFITTPDHLSWLRIYALQIWEMLFCTLYVLEIAHFFEVANKYIRLHDDMHEAYLYLERLRSRYVPVDAQNNVYQDELDESVVRLVRYDVLENPELADQEIGPIEEFPPFIAYLRQVQSQQGGFAGYEQVA